MLKISEKDLKKYASKQSVLIVDDEELIVTMLERKLKRYFSRVESAFNGKEALKKCKDNYFDLIISDIKMPVMNGIMFLKEIRKQDINKRVIFMSAYDENEYFIELLNNGADGFLLKPNSEEQLLYILYKSCKVIHQEKLNKQLYKELDEKNTQLTKINLKFRKLYHKLIGKIKRDIEELIKTKELAKDDLVIIDMESKILENISDEKVDKLKENLNLVDLKEESSNKESNKISAKEYLDKIDFFKYNTDILEEIELIDELEYEIESILNREDSVTMELIESVKALLSKDLIILKMLAEFDTLRKSLELLFDILSQIELKNLTKRNDEKLLSYLQKIVDYLMDWKKFILINQDATDIHYLDEELITNCINIQKILLSLDFKK